MNTEITDNVKVSGWILYDGDCRYCTRLAASLRALLARRSFKLAPLQEPWVRERLALPEAELLKEMRLLKADGQVYGGADAVLEIGRAFWWAWPLAQAGRFPWLLKLLRAGYRWIASRRNCGSGACAVGARHRWTDFLPLILLLTTALLCRSQMTPWVFMWALAFALYAGCKWFTYCLAARITGSRRPWLGIGYLLLWPGMNAKEFLNSKTNPPKPKVAEWIFGLAKTIFVGVLLCGIAREFRSTPLAAGWAGMVGVVFLIHFGLFSLLSLMWRRLGVPAPPVMNNPLRATSVADFWGGRWNTAFNELAFRFVFRPIRQHAALPLATFAVFALSGLIHDLLISYPARGGYGLPTLYFLTQAAGIAIERSGVGHRLGLAHGLRGWCFTVVFTAGPAFWLFHPPFIHNVILPMLTAIGAN